VPSKKEMKKNENKKSLKNTVVFVKNTSVDKNICKNRICVIHCQVF
jgi:hypothetical protein